MNNIECHLKSNLSLTKSIQVFTLVYLLLLSEKTEPNTRLQALIATLSTGPVGPGDGIGFINKTLLMK